MAMSNDRNCLLNIDFSVLFDACAEGDLSVLELYLNPLSASDISQIRDEYQATLLHHSARYGHRHILRYLIEAKRLDYKELSTENGARCIHDAAVCDQVETMHYLFNYDKIYSDRMNGSSKIFDWSIQDIKGNNLLHLAAGYGSINALQYLLKEHSADPYVRSHDGLLPIHCACLGGYYESAKVLLSAAPDTVNQQTKTLLTPAYLSCQSGSLEIIQLLSSYEADFRLRDAHGSSCLHAACFHGHLPIVKWLIETKNANINETDQTNSNVLHYAAYNGDPSIITYLLEKNANVLIASNGNTPLHVAAEYGRSDACTILIERANCSICKKNNSNLTAIDLADLFGFPVLADQLRRQMELTKSLESATSQSSTDLIQLTNATVVRLVVKKKNVERTDASNQVNEDDLPPALNNFMTDEQTDGESYSTVKTLTNKRFDLSELRARVEAHEGSRFDSTKTSYQVDDVLMHSLESLNKSKRNRKRFKLPAQTYAPWLKMGNITSKAFQEEIQRVGSNLRKVGRDSLLRSDGILEDVNQLESHHSRSTESLMLRKTTNDQSFSSNIDRFNSDDDRRSSKHNIQPQRALVPISKSHQFIIPNKTDANDFKVPTWQRELIERRRAAAN